MQIIDIAKEFLSCDQPTDIKELGNGHINATYLITGQSKQRYVLQQINKNVFKKPRELMYNIMVFGDFVKTKTDDPRAFLNFLKTKEEKTYFLDEKGNFWRMYVFVENSVCVERPTLSEFRECGRAFGEFLKYLADFDAAELFETIPDFHNTPKRFDDLMTAYKEDEFDRTHEVAKEIKFFKARKEYYSLLIDANKENKLPLRVTHNDTKCNNVLLDEDTRRGLCVIDLDTIMPGFSVTDFGDAIRFGASTAAEDEKDTNKISLDTEYVKAYADGYIEGAGGKMEQGEKELLFDGAIMMTLECGMRFLTDYLCGDTYFKTDYKGHNLVRARAQIALAKDMESKKAQMINYIKNLGL